MLNLVCIAVSRLTISVVCANDVDDEFTEVDELPISPFELVLNCCVEEEFELLLLLL